jgi:hypothetical protein
MRVIDSEKLKVYLLLALFGLGGPAFGAFTVANSTTSQGDVIGSLVILLSVPFIILFVKVTIKIISKRRGDQYRFRAGPSTKLN